MVRSILANPRYTGRQVWNRQPTSHELIDPANTGLGHRQVQRSALPGSRCGHGHFSAATPDPARPKNLYVREDHILPHLAGLHVRLTGREFPAERRGRTRRGAEVSRKVNQQDAIGYLRARRITLASDAQTRTLQADTPEAVTTVVIGRAS